MGITDGAIEDREIFIYLGMMMAFNCKLLAL